MLLDFLQPVLHIGEGLLPGNVVAQEHAVGASVEDPSDRAERLLAGRVPDLQLHDLAVQLDYEGPELDADRHLVLQLELVVHHAGQQARLTNAYPIMLSQVDFVPVSPMMISLNISSAF